MVVNELEGVLKDVKSESGLYFFEVDVEGDAFFALQLHNGYKHKNIKLRFRENDVSIAKKIDEPQVSISNIQKATVKSIENGSLLARVELLYKEKSIYSLITQRSLEKLNIKTGDEVYFLVKALSIEVFCE